MKLHDIYEEAHPSDGSSPTDDMQFADDISSREAGDDRAPSNDNGWKRTKRTGNNSKKAARIASMARTAAKDADPIDDDTPSQSGQHMSVLRLNR